MKSDVNSKLQKLITHSKDARIKELLAEMPKPVNKIEIYDDRAEMELTSDNAFGRKRPGSMIICLHGKEGAILALNQLSDRMFNPKTKAWMRITEVINVAQSDPAIADNPDAMEFLAMMKTLSDEAWGHWNIRNVLKPLVDFLKSENASFAASQKNEEPRKWVLSEWLNRPDQGQKKAPFSRQYALLVKKKFGLIVLPEQISRNWLPKTKK